MDPIIISILPEPWMDRFILAEGTNGVKRLFMEWFKMEVSGEDHMTKYENKILELTENIKTLCNKVDTLTRPSGNVATEGVVITANATTASVPIASVATGGRTYLHSSDCAPTDPEELARSEEAVAAIIHAAATERSPCVPPSSKPKQVVKKKKIKKITKCVGCGKEFDDGRKMNCHKRNGKCTQSLVLVNDAVVQA